MTIYRIPICVQIPARGTVEVEAESFESACIKVQADIDENGLLSNAAEADFTADWENARELSLDHASLPIYRR